MSNAVVSAFKNKQLRKKLLFTTLILIVVRFGSQLPIPEIDSAQISAYLKSTLGDSFSLLNSFTGGSFMQMSVFALSVTPYITSSIIMQLMTIVIPALEEMQKDGEDGRKRMAKITRYVTVVLAIIEGAGLAIGFANQGALGTDYTTFTIVTMIIALTAGAVLVMWLGERITESGIGNGISIILLVNIVSGMPGDFTSLYNQFMKGKQIGPALIAGCVIVGVVLAVVVFVIVLSDAERHIPVQYSKKMQGRKLVGGQQSKIPLKVNTAGVIPIIFASSIMQFPIMLQNVLKYENNGFIGKALTSLNSSTWFDASHPKRSIGLLIYIVLVVLFAYFYTSITFNPLEISNNMKKQGGFIPGIRPGKPTVDYLNKILKYIMYKKRTENEIRIKFNTIDEDLLEDSIEYLKEAGYINDKEYIERSVAEFKNLKNMSIKEVIYKLYSKGIKKDTLEDYVSNHIEELEEYEKKSAENIINKKINNMEKEAFFKLSYGLYIITTKQEEHFAGCVVNTVVQATAEENPKLLVTVNKDNDTNTTMSKSKKVNISVLSQDADMLLIGKFGFRSSKDFNKLQDTEHIIGSNAIPIITQNVTSYIEAEIIHEIDCGTHTVFILEAKEAKVLNDNKVLTYDYYHNVIKGKTPKKASSFSEN